MTNRTLIRSLFWIVLLGITVLSLIPIDQPDFSPNDKVNHFIAWTTLAALAGLGWRHQNWLYSVLLAYGFVIELLQGLTGYRTFSLADGFTNAAGIAVAIIGVRLWYKVEERLEKSRGYR